MAIIIVQQGQNLIDIAIQHCGSATALVELAVLNDLSVTDDVAAGQELMLPTPINTALIDYYLSKSIVPSTDKPIARDYNDLSQEGIDFWIIENDFVVQ